MNDQRKRVLDYQTSSIAGIAAIKPAEDRGERNSLSMRRSDASGLTILGTEVGCGKTAFMTGLSAVLKQDGVYGRAVKPVCIGPKDRSEAEISFISSITGTPKNYSAIMVPTAKNLTNAQWTQALSICLNSNEMTMVETPSSLSSPMTFEQSNSCGLAYAWKDSTDFAAEVHFPVIIVARHNEWCVERLILAWSYANSQGLTVVGTATVETAAGEGQVLESKLTRSEISLLLNSRTRAPYLGCLKHSPSISVHRVNQGNIVKMTESGIDMLEVRKALEPVEAKT